jgi:peptide/nickel transport system permease protein
MPWRSKHKGLLLGCTMLAGIFLFALFAPLLGNGDPSQMSLADRYSSPSLQHFFGLDQNGGDVWTQVLYGARVSLTVALIVVAVSVWIGLLVGSIAGYAGGWVDQIIMRFIDMLYAFPGFLLALALVAVLGPSIQNLILAMCATGWAGYARLVRGEVLHLKTRDYVTSAVSLGAKPWRILSLHIWPNLFGILVVQALFGLSATILTESSLSFLGLGAPPSTPTWGSLLNSGRKVLIEAPHVSIFPGLAILLLVLAFNLVGDGLRAILNPRQN